MSKRHVGAQSQPFLGLILHVCTTRVAVVFRMFHLTAVVQIADAGVVAETARVTADRSVVFLTKCTVNGLVVPVVGGVIVLTVPVSKGGMRVQLEVGSDEFFTIGNGVNLITQTAVFGVEKVGICILFGPILA